MRFHQIIKALLVKKDYNKYRPYVEALEDEKPLLDALDRCHDSTDNDVTIDELSLMAGDNLKSAVIIVDKEDISSTVLSKALQDHMEKVWAHRQALALLDVTEGRKSLTDTLLPPLEEGPVLDEQEKHIVTRDLDVLLSKTDRSGGLQWRLKDLKEKVGGLQIGDFTIIMARVETGKTTFICSEVSNMALQTPKDHPVIHFNNEERGEKVMLRYYQAVFGKTYYEIRDNKEDYQRRFKENVSLYLYDKATIHRREVERVIKELQPSLVVFDQLDKIGGFKADRPDLKLGKIYVWAREIAKTYCPVIAVCQASANAEHKKWLDMSDMADSRTSKAAEADLIIGIGATDEGYEYTRYLHLVKNKISGQHSKITCMIEPQIARYKEIS